MYRQYVIFGTLLHASAADYVIAYIRGGLRYYCMYRQYVIFAPLLHGFAGLLHMFAAGAEGMLVHRYRAAVEVVQGGEIIPGPAVQQHEIHDKYAHKCRCTLRGVNRNLRIYPQPELILVAVLAEAKIRRMD